MPPCTSHSQVLCPFSGAHTSQQLMIRLPQTRAFTGGEEHGAVHPDQAKGEQSPTKGSTPAWIHHHGILTKNKGFKETYNPNDSHLLALKLDEMFYLLPRASVQQQETQGTGNLQAKQDGEMGRKERRTGRARCKSLQVHSLFRADLWLRSICYQR